MRQRLAWVFVALTVMLVVGFLVPLGLSLRSQAELRSLASAQSDARGMATALAAALGTRVIHDDMVSPVADLTVLVGKDFHLLRG